MAGSRTPSGRFAPGQSGNPAGRPRRKKLVEKAHSAFDVLLDRRIRVVMNGVERELTIPEALFYRTYQDALGGSRMAIRMVLKKINEREARRAPDVPRWPIIRFEEPDPANVDGALVILGISTPSVERMRPNGRPFLELEPWAVAMGLARPKMPRLDHKQTQDLKERTRNPGAVTWPKSGED